MSSFDPYHKWLGIAPKDQPPNHYRLLAIDLFESDPDVISAAADQRMAHVRSFQTGKNADLSQRVLNEIAGARVCLLHAEKKAKYDVVLRALLDGRKATAPAAPPVVAAPLAPPRSVAPPPLAAVLPPEFADFVNASVATPAVTPRAPPAAAKPRKSSEGRQLWLGAGMLTAAAVLLIAVLAVKFGRSGDEVGASEPPPQSPAVEEEATRPVKPEAEPQPVPEPQPQPEAGPKSAPQPDPKPEAEPPAGPKPAAQVEPAKAEPEPEPPPPKADPQPQQAKPKPAPPDSTAQKKPKKQQQTPQQKKPKKKPKKKLLATSSTAQGRQSWARRLA